MPLVKVENDKNKKASATKVKCSVKPADAKKKMMKKVKKK